MDKRRKKSAKKAERKWMIAAAIRHHVVQPTKPLWTHGHYFPGHNKWRYSRRYNHRQSLFSLSFRCSRWWWRMDWKKGGIFLSRNFNNIFCTTSLHSAPHQKKSWRAQKRLLVLFLGGIFIMTMFIMPGEGTPYVLHKELITSAHNNYCARESSIIISQLWTHSGKMCDAKESQSTWKHKNISGEMVNRFLMVCFLLVNLWPLFCWREGWGENAWRGRRAHTCSFGW